MKHEVTRDVVSDLWPLCRSGDASVDSRALIETFLAQDDAFAGMLKASEKLPSVTPVLKLSPDAERRLLDDARDRARGKLILIGAAVGLAGVLASASLAGALWILLRSG